MSKQNTLSEESRDLASRVSKLMSEPGKGFNKVSEQDFIDTYLPIAALYHSKEQIDVGYWVGKAGSIYNGLTVVDAAGETLFITPPLITMVSARIEGGMLPMIDELKSAPTPAMKDAVAERHLNGDTVKLSIPDTGSRIVDWHRIFTKYGYKMVPTEGSQTPSVDSVDTTPVDDRDGEDEFV